MPTTSLIESLKDLGDEDVKLLYEVAFLAQQSSTLPIRALYDAYDQVLPQFGTVTQHDDRCFRWLSHARMELAKDGTKSILKRFRALLALADIQVGHEGDDGISEIAVSEVRTERGHTVDVDEPHRVNKRRRASFNDSNLDTTWISGDRHQPEPHPSLAAKSQRPSRRDRVRSASIDRDQLRHHHLAPPDVWSQPEVALQLNADAEYMYFTAVARRYIRLWHARSTQLRRRHQDLLQMATNHDRRTLLKQSFASMRDNAFTSRFRDQQERRVSRVRDLYLLTKAFTHWAQVASDQVVRTNVAKRHILRTRYFNAWRDITTVNELKCRQVGLRKWFGLWRSKAETVTTNNQLATVIREKHLLRLSYRQWFFRICEQQAPMWKDSRLQIKYFQHWRNRSDVVQSMTLAAQGRHNMSLLRTTFGCSRRRFALVQDLDVISINFRRRSSLATFLRMWRRKTTFKPSEARAVAAKDVRLVKKAFNCWRHGADTAYQAREVDRRRLLANALTAWNDRLRSTTLQLRINERVQLQALYKWVLEERFVLFRRVMEHRQKTNAIRQISTRIATRRFELDEATQIFQHNRDTRTAQWALVKLHAQLRRREHDQLIAVEFRNARLLPKCFQIWTSQSAQARQRVRWASQARFYCLTTMAIRRWKTAAVNQQKARRREAYATVRRRQKVDLAHRCLALLQERASHMSTLQDRAETFCSRGASSMLQSFIEEWHIETERRRAAEQEAERMNVQSHLQEAFAALRGKLDILRERHADARSLEQLSTGRLAAKSLRKMSDSVFVLRRHVDTASAWKDRKFVQHQRDMLRYWALKANEKRAYKNAGDADSPSRTPAMRASKMSQIRSRALADTSTLGDKVTSRAEQWTRFDDLAIQPDNIDHTGFSLGATPGYLRTPSRRTARARARFKSIPDQTAASRFRTSAAMAMDFGSSVVGSTTPAPLAPGQLENMETLTPQVTPFQRKMRAGGYRNSTTPLSAPRFVGGVMGGFAASSQAPPGTERTVRFDEAEEDELSMADSRMEQSPSKGQ